MLQVIKLLYNSEILKKPLLFIVSITFLLISIGCENRLSQENNAPLKEQGWSVLNKISDMVRKIFTGEEPPGVHIDICVDITRAENLDSELEEDYNFILGVIETLQTGDRLDVFAIHAKSYSFQKPILKAPIPPEISPGDKSQRDAKERAKNELEKNWERDIEKNLNSEKTMATDIAGMLRYVAEHKRNVDASWHVIVLLSDMQHVDKKYNFEHTPPNEEILGEWSDRGMIHKLNNTTVFVFRCSCTHGISNDHYRSIKRFWGKYFEISEATLVAYCYDHDQEILIKTLNKHR